MSAKVLEILYNFSEFGGGRTRYVVSLAEGTGRNREKIITDTRGHRIGLEGYGTETEKKMHTKIPDTFVEVEVLVQNTGTEKFIHMKKYVKFYLNQIYDYYFFFNCSIDTKKTS